MPETRDDFSPGVKAMTPLGFEGSDGLQNLTESLLAVQLLAPGIHVVIHGPGLPQ